MEDMGDLSIIAGLWSGWMQMDNISKEPDGSWGPRNASYVTCVPEIGHSSNANHLDNDA